MSDEEQDLAVEYGSWDDRRNRSWKKMRTALIASLLFIGLTLLVGCFFLFGVSSLGGLEYLLYSGIMFGWFHIWGDAYNNSVGEHLTEIGISLAVNGAVGFVIGLCLHPLLRLRKKA